MQNLVKFHQFVQKILCENRNLTITKGHNCFVYLRKLMCSNPNLDLVNINMNDTEEGTLFTENKYFCICIHVDRLQTVLKVNRAIQRLIV